jgi:hypothetical protein
MRKPYKLPKQYVDFKVYEEHEQLTALITPEKVNYVYGMTRHLHQIIRLMAVERQN